MKKDMGCFMEDCIHLCACRRMSKIFGHIKGRNCSETCKAYQTIDEIKKEYGLYTEDQVEDVKHGACEAGRLGYSGGDLLIEDFI